MKNEQPKCEERKNDKRKNSASKGEDKSSWKNTKGEKNNNRKKLDDLYFVLQPKDLEDTLNYLSAKPWMEVNHLIQKLSNLQKGKRIYP